MENLYLRQLDESEQVKLLFISLYIQDTVQKSEPGSYSKLKSMVPRYLELKIRGTHLFSRDRLNEKLNPVVPSVSAEGKGEGRRKGGHGDCNQWAASGQSLRGQACSLKHDPAARGEGDGKRQRCLSPYPRRKSIDADGKRAGTSPSATPDKPLCFKVKQRKCDKEATCDSWHPTKLHLSPERSVQRRKQMPVHSEKDRKRKGNRPYPPQGLVTVMRQATPRR